MSRLASLKRVFDTILKEAETNPGFAERLAAALNDKRDASALPRPGRRKPGPLDPFLVYADGEEALRYALRLLDLEQLKDIVAEHGMDLAKLAMKWKTPDRLIDLIVTTVRTRSQKGDAFRGTPRAGS